MAEDPGRNDRDADAGTAGTAVWAAALTALPFVFGLYVIIAALSG
jgi:hypothetical protein